MDELIKSITEAEAEAAEIKARAQETASGIVAQAEIKCSAILKASEEECKKLRERTLKKAEADALSEYEKTLAAKKEEVEAYTAGITENTDGFVKEIVGRISGGGR